MKNKITVATLTVCFLVAFSTIANAQTIYKKEPGLFVPVLESFSLNQSHPTRIIGPAIGYRFNDRFDLMLHSEISYSNRDYIDRKIGLVNLGLVGGYTLPVTSRLDLRTDLQFYKFFDPRGDHPSNNKLLGSIAGSSSLYWEVPFSESIIFRPNIGGFAGYGFHEHRYSGFRNDFKGYRWGAQVGFDTEFKMSDDFSITFRPHARFYEIHGSIESGLSLRLNF